MGDYTNGGIGADRRTHRNYRRPCSCREPTVRKRRKCRWRCRGSHIQAWCPCRPLQQTHVIKPTSTLSLALAWNTRLLLSPYNCGELSSLRHHLSLVPLRGAVMSFFVFVWNLSLVFCFILFIVDATFALLTECGFKLANKIHPSMMMMVMMINNKEEMNISEQRKGNAIFFFKPATYCTRKFCMKRHKRI